jgi:hypothetical protein
MRHIDTAVGASEIAQEILADRPKPLVLISTTPEGEFVFDADVIAREVRGDADVVTIATGEATYALEKLLPIKAHVFNGAARSYPPDFGADPDWQRSLLRFPGRTDDDLIDDALAQVTVALFVASPKRTWVRATVELVSGGSGNIARLDNGQRVMVVADALPPTLKLADALVVGERVEGWLTDRDLAPEPATVDLAAFVNGSVTLARVTKTTDLRATLVLHPQAPETVLRKRDVVPGVDAGENADTKVTDVVRVGQTVRARVVASGKTLGLSLIDTDDSHPYVAPLPLLRGGAPWLQEGVDAEPDAPVPVAPAPSVAPASAEPPALAAGAAPTAAVPASQLAEVRDEMAGLKEAFLRLGRELRAGTDLETLNRLRDESVSLSAELHRERAIRREQDTTLARLRQELRQARAAQPEPQTAETRTARSVWPDGQSWLRYEITSTWAARTIASEKRQYPLAEYSVGPRFLDSISALGDGYLEKVLRGVVDVLTGRAADIPARELHRLRAGEGGGDPYVVRDDGAVCWRVSLESNTASARRLHYWQLPGGRIELSRAVLHDDFEP